jgi:fibronectin-binding autotransporter adhesin
VTDVAQSNCEFDLGTRALRIDKPLEVAGQGFIKVLNTGNITITSAGKLKARGDLVQPNGFIGQGGLISLTSSGAIINDGLLDVSGDLSGRVVLSATGDITLASGSNVDGNGISSFADLGQKFADGGTLDIASAAGSIAINGRVTLRGTNQGAGGEVDAIADRNVTVNQSIDITGGGGDGGQFNAAAGDRIVVTRAIDADSRTGGGSGGSIDLRAGCDALTCNALHGVVPGGNIDIQGAALTLRGSASDGYGGDGGSLYALAAGTIHVFGSGSRIRVDGATNFDGSGGHVSLDTSGSDPNVIEPTDGDIMLDAPITGMSGSLGGNGCGVDLLAGGDLLFTGTMDCGGTDQGGAITGIAGRAISLGGNGAIKAQATSPAGEGGAIAFTAGSASDAESLGNLSVQKDIVANGGTMNGDHPPIVLAGCGLSVGNGVVIDGHAGVNAANMLGGSDIDLVSRRPMQLVAGSKYLAGPGGTIETIHPPGQNPSVGAGVTFDPNRTDTVTTTSPPLPNCGMP